MNASDYYLFQDVRHISHVAAAAAVAAAVLLAAATAVRVVCC